MLRTIFNVKLQPFIETPGRLLLINMLVSGEDHRFKFHPGFDVIAICRASYKNLIYGTHEGASTIEQQLVRVLTNRYERTISRKISEIWNACYLCLKYDKKTIAWNYLIRAYYGTYYTTLSSILSKYNYNIDDDVSIEICAEIIARLKYPEPKILSRERERIITRRVNYILNLYRRYKTQNKYLFL